MTADLNQDLLAKVRALERRLQVAESALKKAPSQQANKKAGDLSFGIQSPGDRSLQEVCLT